MKLDLYTKSVLTIIAACLLWIAAQTPFRTVSAQSGVQQVQLVDKMGVPYASISGVGSTFGVPVTVQLAQSGPGTTPRVPYYVKVVQ